MARFCVCPTTGLRRGAWTLEEDELLASHIARHGHSNWRLVPEKAGLARDGKSCRLRWMNYLRPDLKRGNFTEEEDEIIIGLHERLGNRWSAIALSLPGRTDNEIKNHWHTELKKRNVTVEVARPNSTEPSTVIPLLSPLTSSGSLEILNVQNQTVENDVDFDLDGEFWKDPFTLQNAASSEHSSGEFFSPLEEASPSSPYEASNYNENDRSPMPDYLSIVNSPRKVTLEELFDM